jgi:hypothetical protein
LSAVYGEPKEQFQWKCHSYKIKPKYQIDNPEPIPTILSDENGETIEANLVKCEILFRNDKKMCGSVGSTRR